MSSYLLVDALNTVSFPTDMKAGKVPVIICNAPHPQSRHARAKQLFIANNRMWVDRCGEPRLPPGHADDSDFVPSDDDPHDHSLSSMSINSRLVQGKSRRIRQMPRTPTPTPSPDFSFSPDYSDDDTTRSISSKGKGKARAYSRAQSDEEEEEEGSRPSKRSRSTMKLRSRK